ncbi:hypothetical protein [Desulfobulbus sp.]|nr:hypothetical protein [Desulfobulbus sp.]
MVMILRRFGAAEAASSARLAPCFDNIVETVVLVVDLAALQRRQA